MDIALSPSILFVLLGLAFFLWIGATAVLLYHWNTYTRDDRRVRRMKRVYFICSGILFLSSLTFIFSL